MFARIFAPFLLAALITATSASAEINQRMIKDVMSLCDEEMQAFATRLRLVSGKEQYVKTWWQIYVGRSGVVLFLNIQSNIAWLSSSVDPPGSLMVILYGTYHKDYGWVWFAHRNMSAPAGASELWQWLAALTNTAPATIISSDKEPERTIAIRYLCAVVLNERIFPPTP